MKALFILLVLILVAAVIIYFLPGTIHIEKTMVLKAQPEVVYEKLNIFNFTGVAHSFL